MSAFDITTCARPNILMLEPYRCARDDYADDGVNVLLDANENAYGPSLDLASAANAPAAIDFANLNRYPDPHQIALKALLCRLRNAGNPSAATKAICGKVTRTPSPPPQLTPDHLFVGVGSDEAIDALIRCFCTPGRDKILVCPPTYGMYGVCAQINDVGVVSVPLATVDVDEEAETEDGDKGQLHPWRGPRREFQVDANAVSAALTADPTIKLVFLCSPGNPTGQLVAPEAVRALLAHPTWNGVVVVDEAYVDFAGVELPPSASSSSSPPDSTAASPDGETADPSEGANAASLARAVSAYPNLVVLQTLSKAFGLAGIRLGAAFASPPAARLLNSLKAPYNVSSVTAALARAALSPANLATTSNGANGTSTTTTGSGPIINPGAGLETMRAHRSAILAQRARLVAALPSFPGIGRLLGGLDANFLVIQVLDRPARFGQEGARPSNPAAQAVYRRLAEEKGVVVRYRGKEAGCEGGLRVTVGTEAEVDKFLDVLGGVLADVYSAGEGGAK